MMTKICIFFLFLFVYNFLISQVQYRYSSLRDLNIFPSNPTTDDSVLIPFDVVFTATGGQKKFSSLLSIYADTILYSGCYYCGCSLEAVLLVPDTVKLAPLTTGLYHVKIIARYAATLQDTFCVDGSSVYNDTIDTIFRVSQVNSIETPGMSPFYAFLENFNTLIINAGTPGRLNLKLYDELGRQVSHNNEINIQQGNNAINLPIPPLSPGIYFYHLSVGEKERVLKYVKI